MSSASRLVFDGGSDRRGHVMSDAAIITCLDPTPSEVMVLKKAEWGAQRLSLGYPEMDVWCDGHSRCEAA